MQDTSTSMDSLVQLNGLATAEERKKYTVLKVLMQMVGRDRSVQLKKTGQFLDWRQFKAAFRTAHQDKSFADLMTIANELYNLQSYEDILTKQKQLQRIANMKTKRRGKAKPKKRVAQ